MDGRHKGFHVDDGVYEGYARNIDPFGEEFDRSARDNVAAHTDLAGDGFSVMGGEAGFTGAYGNQMRELESRMTAIGGKWREMAEAARNTSKNYQVVQDEQAGELGDIGKALG